MHSLPKAGTASMLALLARWPGLRFCCSADRLVLKRKKRSPLYGASRTKPGHRASSQMCHFRTRLLQRGVEAHCGTVMRSSTWPLGRENRRACRHASDKLNKLLSLEVAACRASPHCGMPSPLKTRLGSALSDRIPAVSQKTYIRPRPSSIRPGLYRRRSEFA
jgi:hypothetical protein